MQERQAYNRASKIARLLSIILVGCGTYAFWLLIAGLIKTVWHRSTAGDVILSVIFGLLLMLVSAWYLRAAWLGWQHRTARGIRSLAAAVASLAFFVAAHLLASSEYPDPGKSFASPWRGALARAIGPLLIAMIYLVLNRFLSSRLGLKDERSVAQQRWSVERWLGVPTFLFWTGGSGLLFDVVNRKNGHRHPPEDASDFIAIFTPIILAVVIYKVGVWYFAPRAPATSVAQAEPL